ncbi:MAG: class I SAM-dependent methyltransferase [Chloroflexia bacterium]|nr:class I SAM-dependent methyltransferase [Chloroflexia bacterium]
MSETETDRIRRLYDECAATYDSSLGVVERLVLGPLRAEFGALLQGETIEIGIGSGLNLPFYTAAVTRAVGVDLSGEMLRLAEKRARDLRIPIICVRADAATLPFADASFDTVAVSLALCTIPDPAQALREVSRVCRPDGRVVLLEHVVSTKRPLAALLRALSPLNERAIGCHLDRNSFDLATSLGFSVEVCRRRLFDIFRLATARPPIPVLPSIDGNETEGASA